MRDGADMVTVKYRHVHEDVDRHGNVRLYFKRRGQKKIRLREKPGTEAFAAEYKRALNGETEASTPAIVLATPGTWRWLCEQHFASGEFRQLEESTQAVRRGILEATFDEPREPGAKETFADCPISRMTTKAVVVLRDRKGTLFDAANNRVKAIHRVFSWALQQVPPLADSNPARDVPKLRGKGGGHHTWTINEVERYERRHPPGSKARLALALFLYTGQRRSDVVLLGRQHARNGWLRFTQYKNRRRSPVTLEIPILPVLQQELDAVPPGVLTYLVTEYRRPFTAKGFGSWFKARCREAGLPERCTAHGLRKAGAVRAAENGATAHQLMAIFGWKTLAEAERYTRKAEQKRMAGEAMPLLARTEEG